MPLSPCVCSRVKYALGLPNRFRGNKKKVTAEYWNRVIDEVLESHHNHIVPLWKINEVRNYPNQPMNPD